MCGEHRGEFLCQKQGALGVDGKLFVEVVGGDFGYRGCFVEAGVVDQNVETIKLFCEFSIHGVGCVVGSEIHLNCRGMASHQMNEFNHFPGLFCTVVAGDDHIHAFGSESKGDGASDPAGSAGD